MIKDYKEYDLFSAQDETGVSNVIYVDDFANALIAIDTDNSANLTVKVCGSIADDAPDFSAAKSPSNSYEFIQVKDYEDGSSIDGDTGFSVSGTDDNRLFEVNTNALRWLALRVTARSAGDVTAKLRVYNNS